MKRILTILFALLACTVHAQERNIRLTISAASVEGDDLTGQEVVLKHTEYDMTYEPMTLDANGTCSILIYAGPHLVTIRREGFELAEQRFDVAEGTTEYAVSLILREKTRAPFALTATNEHNAYTGTDDVTLTWNTEAPAFFDDFESYPGWAVSFGEWTGIDGDEEAAAALLGSYPNRGVMQYAQIINPLTVEPTWWYDYPILRPYSGSQYVGFTRTSSGNKNDDWLISPAINVGTENIVSFMGKAADQFYERFMVYVTTKTDNPTTSDFVRLDQGSYETADMKGWKEYAYDLSAYAGQTVKIAIRYISEYNRYGSFMLMVDDFYVGQALSTTLGTKKKGCARRSPANPNEQFRIYLDGQQVGTTDAYSYRIENVAAGQHTLGVQAVYVATESEVVTTDITLSADIYARVAFNVTAQSLLSPDGQTISLVNTATTQSYQVRVQDGRAVIPSLPMGDYMIHVVEGAFSEWQQALSVSGDCTIDIALTDNILMPYNITAKTQADGTVLLTWNQKLQFYDSFEDYDDFATGSFGEWISIDRDQMPVYPISLQNSIISFPGSGTQYNPTAIAPMVFNPWKTKPAMLPTDQAVAAPTGDKTVIFFSPQRVEADKWLISPLIDINEGYQLSVTAKGYEASYPESMEFCISEEGSKQPNDFTALSVANPVSAGQWAAYETDLSAYAGKTVRLAIHYTSFDAFFTQIDDFTVGPANGEGEVVDYGNVVRFDIYLDQQKVGESQQPSFVLNTPLTPGEHTVGIKAIYQNAESETAEYRLTVESSGIATVQCTLLTHADCYNLQGMRMDNTQSLPHGIYLVKNGNGYRKVRK